MAGKGQIRPFDPDRAGGRFRVKTDLSNGPGNRAPLGGVATASALHSGRVYSDLPPPGRKGLGMARAVSAYAPF